MSFFSSENSVVVGVKTARTVIEVVEEDEEELDASTSEENKEAEEVLMKIKLC